jgi:hypothetical protein
MNNKKEERKSRNHDIKLMLGKEEKERLQKEADKLGITLTAYIRMTSLNAKVRIE